MADYFDELDTAVAEESSSGGGIIALTRVDVGFKVYATGAQLSENSPAGKTPYTQGMTFFPAGPDKPSREKALTAAKAFASAVGSKPPNGLSTHMVCFREGAIMMKKGEWGPVEWKVDQEYVESLWERKDKEGNIIKQSDGSVVVKPALKAIGLPMPWERWTLVKSRPAPSGRQKKQQDGTEGDDFVKYPAQVFDSEAEAKASLQSGTNGKVEAGFNLAEWEPVKADLVAAVKAKTKELKNPGKAKEAVASEYGLTVENLEKVIA